MSDSREAAHTKGPWKKVGDYMWRADGKPEYAGPTSAYRSLYHDQAREVLQALHDMGYTLKKRSLAASKET